MSEANGRVVVLGVGNLLLTDEGIGPHAINALNARYAVAEPATLVDGGTSAMELLDDMARADLLLILDAVRSGRSPGSFVKLTGEEVPRFFTTKLSPHQVGIADVLATLELAGESPKETVVMGVEPADLGMGMELSPTVAAALPRLVEEVVGELDRRGVAVRARSA